LQDPAAWSFHELGRCQQASNRRTFATATVIAGQERGGAVLHRRAAGEGHILLEDVPASARLRWRTRWRGQVSLSFQRIQFFTSDLLPADIVGVTIYNRTAQEFEFISGGLYTSCWPRDQSRHAEVAVSAAEAMSEGMISVEKKRPAAARSVPGPGDAESDRARGDISAAESPARSLPDEADHRHPNTTDEKSCSVPAARTCAGASWRGAGSAGSARSAGQVARRIHVNESLVDYLMTIVHTTRSHPGSALGRFDARRR